MNQFKKIALIVLVFGIWLTVGYKIYHQFRPKTDVQDSSTTNTISTTKEPYQLLLDYPNPFIRNQSLEKESITTPKSTQKSKVSATQKSVKPVKMPTIKYYGYAKKVGNNVFLALSVNGEGYVIKPHEKIDGVEIVLYSEDSIVCRQRNQIVIARVLNLE